MIKDSTKSVMVRCQPQVLHSISELVCILQPPHSIENPSVSDLPYLEFEASLALYGRSAVSGGSMPTSQSNSCTRDDPSEVIFGNMNQVTYSVVSSPINFQVT